jgi:hypothetical protein
MKLLVWLARKAASVAVIAGLSLYSSWFVVNLYVEQMMKHYQIEGLGTKIQFSDVVASLGEEWHIVSPRRDAASTAGQTAQAEQGRAAPVTAKPAGSGDAAGNAGGPNGNGGGMSGSSGSGEAGSGTNGFGTASASTAGSGASSADTGGSSDGSGASGTAAPQGAGTPSGGAGQPPQTGERVPEDAVAVSGRLSQSQDQSGSSGASSARSAQDSLVMSTDDFAKKKAAMSSDDKMKLFSLLMNKLPPDQLQAMSAMVEDGITSDELKQLDTTLKKYLSKDEYQQILDIIQKY